MKAGLMTVWLLSAAVLMGCTGPTMVMLQHPDTKDIRECKGDAWANWDPYTATEECAQALERAGYKRLGQY